jgi:hypothetical protein
MKIKTIYFAHPVSLYNTDIERRATEKLLSMGWSVLCPNAEVHQQGYADFGFAYFHSLVRRTNAIAYQSDRGCIGPGVASELLEAVVNGKDIYYLGNEQDVFYCYEPNLRFAGLTVRTIAEQRAINKEAKQ